MKILEEEPFNLPCISSTPSLVQLPRAFLDLSVLEKGVSVLSC